MALLHGKHILVTGVLTERSLAFGIAETAQAQGATVLLTGAGRGLSVTRRAARKLADPPEVLEFDAADPDAPAALRDALAERWPRVDGAVHAIGFAPEICLGGDVLRAQWEDVAVALQISAYSLKALADAVVPHMSAGGAILGLDFDARVAWPAYDWMGVAKAALESTSRYLARDLGPRDIRVNLVAAGPVRTVAARSIPGFAAFEDTWNDRAPLGWDVRADADAVARTTVALLSDWFPKTTGEMIHVDGGVHAVGA